MAVMQVFLSHSSADRAVAERVVGALRGAQADVWFDEHNLGPGVLLKEITRELRTRPVFIVLLSEKAIGSPWVQNECEWAFTLRMQDPSRVILPVVVAPLQPTALNELLYLSTFKRVEGPNHTPYPEAETLERTLRLLALTPAGQAPTPVAPQPTESVDDLLTQGKALAAQKRWAEALPFFQRATDRAPTNAAAWGELGRMLGELKRYAEALTAHDRALALNERQAAVWNNKGFALDGLGRREEAIAAYDRALAIGETAGRLKNKAITLRALGRVAEAEAAERRAKELGG